MRIIDFDNLPSRDALESMINDMNVDEVLSNLNNARARTLKMVGQVPEEEAYAGALIARRFRALRETKKPSKYTSKKAAPTLDSLL